MTKEKIAKVRAEVERFMERLDALDNAQAKPIYNGWDCPKESGAARRASMDLTRALADFRRY